MILSYAYFGALAIACLSPFVIPALAWFPGRSVWAGLMLVGLVPVAVVGSIMLVLHARRTRAEERARTSLILASFVIAALGASADLASIAGIGGPRIANWALVASAALLATAAFRIKVLARVSVLVGINVAAVGVFVMLAELALYRGTGRSEALLAIGSGTIGVLALLASRFLFGALSEHRERLHADAVLGRMSRQMTHDLRNPLAAIRGAAQFLQGEQAAGRPLEAQAAYLDLLVEQTDRMARVIEQYRRLGRVEPQLSSMDVNALVDRAAASVALGVEKDLASDLPRCDADTDLMTIALENVLRNASEAVGEKGSISVTTTHAGKAVSIVVQDDGAGMDARTRERALEDFFTTKSSGSGLGLSFVRRVVEAHHGRLAIESTEGQGTRVVIEIPVSS